MESQISQPPRIQHIQLSKYSKRVILKTILGRADGGSALIGEKTIVGGWVKSAKEVRKSPPPPLPVAESAHPEKASPAKSANLTCTEILQMSIFRSFLKAFGVSSHQGKLDAAEKPAAPLPSTVFLQLNDGSCVNSLQVVVDSSLAQPEQIMQTGTCILVEGVIQKPSSATPGKHAIELKAENILHLGTVDHERYPLSKKRVQLDALRDWAHIRPRTTTVATMTRVSNSLTHGIHTFFQNNGFLHVQVPIITATDTDQGFTPKFIITTQKKESPDDDDDDYTTSRRVDLETIKNSIREKNNRVNELKRTDSNRETLAVAIQDLNKTNQLAAQLEVREKASKAKHQKLKTLFQRDDQFFSSQPYLTVSGRLHLASYCCALGNVYSFGPRFKAEKTSNPTKQVAEMWKVEAELGFAEMEEAMNCAVDLLKFLSKWVLENCPEDMRFLLKRADRTIADRLETLIAADFEKISYTQVVDALIQVKETQFESEVIWGNPLTEEHESYLVDHIYKRPIIVYGYPKEIKPFYTRVNDDGKTVASFDVLVPKAGAVIRGSQNEERLKYLNSRINEMGLASEQYEWYMDLLRHGSVKHAGFSLVFDQMVVLATGITDVQNIIPFPRSYGNLNH